MSDRRRRAEARAAALRVHAARADMLAAQLRFAADVERATAALGDLADAVAAGVRADVDATLAGHPDLVELEANAAYWHPGLS